MAPSPSPDLRPLDVADQARLLDLAERSIRSGLAGEPAVLPDLDDIPAELRRPCGAFVTVTVDGALNGCIGSIRPREPLAVAVARLAWSAAFADPRLPALTSRDLPGLRIEISVLSPLEPMPVGSRAELVEALDPGTDGLVISAPGHSAVYLPSVWSQLPEPDDFVDQLYRKAGMTPGGWPPGMRADRFTVRSFGRPAAGSAGAGARSGAGEAGESPHE